MFRKWSTSFCVYNILIATHLQPEYTTNTHETRGEHSVRRRGPIHRARILTLPNIHIHFNKYVFSHYQICVSVPHFVGVFIYAGTINRLPTAANGLPKHCERIAKMPTTDCQNTNNTNTKTTYSSFCRMESSLTTDIHWCSQQFKRFRDISTFEIVQ